MSQKPFPNELERALARSDSAHLIEIVSAYHDWSLKRDKVDSEWSGETDICFVNPAEDFDRSFALVILAMARFDEPEFLILVAAGLLEDICTSWPRPPRDLIERMVVEARRTARFRWLLSGVWRDSMDADQSSMLAAAVGTTNCNIDPVPPRPWA